MTRGAFGHRAGLGASSSAPPSGPAGGDLAGTYPDPTAHRVTTGSFPMRDAGAVTRFTWTLAAALVAQAPSTATSVAFNQAQATAGAGAAWTIAAQRGFAGSVGGKLTLQAGYGGTLGTDLAGGIDLDVGQTVGGSTSTLTIVGGASGTILQILGGPGNTATIRNQGAGAGLAGIRIEAVSGVISISSQAGFSCFIGATGGVLLEQTATTAVWYVNSAVTRTETLASAGACAVSWAAGCTSVTYSQAQAGSGTGATWTVRAQQGANPGQGGVLSLLGGAAGSTGTRSAGGAVSIQGGAAGGNSGGGALGGAVTVFGGDGSSSNGGGGSVIVSGGAGGAGGASVGGDVNIRGGVTGGSGGGVVRIQNAAGSADRIIVNDTGMGFFAATPIAKPTVSGSRGANAALASLCTELANLGLIVDNTS